MKKVYREISRVNYLKLSGAKRNDVRKAKHKLEHIVFQSFANRVESVLVAVSGGKDSMALLHALVQVIAKERIIVAHFHHGDFVNKNFRDQAQAMVAQYCQEQGLKLVTEKASLLLRSEQDCRNARNQFFSKVSLQHNTSVVAFAHHLDDWLETQLIKLIRGCSLDSLKQNMEWAKVQRDHSSWLKWRPWIRVSQHEIQEYVASANIPFVQDPTNEESHYFRNWIRNQWLQELEKKRPGAKQTLAFSLIHSLEGLKSLQKKRSFPWNWQNSSLSRLYWESLDVKVQKQCLAYFFYKKKFTQVRRSQIEEIIKQLDKSQNELKLSFKTFDVVVNAERVSILQKT